MKTLLGLCLILFSSVSFSETRLEQQARELQAAGFETKVTQKDASNKKESPLDQLERELKEKGFQVTRIKK